MQRTLLALLISLFACPFFASAVTVQELQQQIATLIAQIEALQQVAGGGSNALPPGPSTPIVTGVPQCPHVSRTLRQGTSGPDVTRLQQFLALDPSVYPEAQVTGFYGALTEAAVKRFQCKFKIVCDGDPNSTGYGVVGPRTAAILALQCPDVLGTGDGAQVGGFIKVTPISGPAPLSVTVEATINTTHSCQGALYEVDFGDGTPPAQIALPPNACSELRQIFTHTYAGGGVYVLTLRSGIHRTTATVTVSGGAPNPGPSTGYDTFESPSTSGSAPFTVTFTGVINAAAQCNAGPYKIAFGDGEIATLPLSGCLASAYTVTHQYTNGGNYVARLTRGDPAQDIGSKSIAVSGSGGSGSGGSYGAYFSVSPVLGGDTASVKAQFDIESSCTAYDLDWGDGSSHATQNQGSCGSGVTSRELTHDYANPGTYTITLRRGQSLSAKDTASITISE